MRTLRIVIAASALLSPTLPAQQPAPLAAPAIEQALGRAGTPNPGAVLKFSFPRSDLSVTLDGVVLRPALALGTWLAFKPVDRGAMGMGALVLLEQEVGPVMQALQKGGVEQSALHNHLIGETPHVMYMHIMAH